MTTSKCERRLESTRIIYDEVLKDIKNDRYKPVGQDSINYLKDMLNTRCIRFFEQVYSKKVKRQERLNGLKSIPQRIRDIIIEYWFPPTMFLAILKLLYKHGCYRLFDDLVIMSKRKNNTND